MKFDFLTLHPQAFGLDLSDLSVKIAYLKEKDGYAKLAFFSETPIPRGLIENGSIKKEDELVELLHGILQKSQKEGLDTRYIVASLPEERAFTQVIQLPKMKREHVAEAVRFEAEKYVPYALETVYVDHQIIREGETHFDVLLSALPREVVDSYLGTFVRAGYSPLALEIESLAISRALIKGYSSQRPMLLIDFGQTSTSLSIFSGNSVRFATSLLVNSDQFTKAIVKTLQIKPEEAERLKQQYGLGERAEQQGKEIFDALIPSATDLTEQLKKYIDYYESHAQHEHLPEQETAITSAMLVGGGSLLKGLPEFLTQSLKIDISLGNPWVNILPEGVREVPEVSFSNSLRYATALGTALRGIQRQEMYD